MKSISRKDQSILDSRIIKKYIQKPDFKKETKQVSAKEKSELQTRGVAEPPLSEESSVLPVRGSSVSDSRPNPNIITEESVQGLSDMVSSRFLYEGAVKARTVGRISKRRGPEPIGTGFLISPNLIITNHHVLKSAEEAGRCYIEFDYYYSKDSTHVKSEIFDLRPEDFYYSNKDYDYAVIMVEAISDHQKELSDYGWNSPRVGGSIIKTTDRLNIIHHPRGGHQQISIRKNYVADIDNEDIYVDYLTDTDYGSSGSPVYNDEWDLIALHRGHVTLTDSGDRAEFLRNLKAVSKDLANEMKGKSITVNIGVKIEVILKDLKNAGINMPLPRQELIEQIFTSPETIQAINATPPIHQTPEISEQEYMQMKNPINHSININGGNITLNLANSISDHPQILPIAKNTIDRKVDLELYNKSLNSQKSIFKALDYVQKARELPYLPAEDELEEIQEDYYEDIISEAGNMSPQEFYDALSAKMQDTFSLVDSFPDPLDLPNDIEEERSNPSSYDKARAHLYTRIDLQRDGSLRGIYSDCVLSPEQLMLVDLINSLDLPDYEVPKRYKNNDYLNCEHIVPKTYFDRKEEGFSDLHHLITTDGNINKFRNKDTYADLGQEGNDGSHRLPDYIQSGGWKRDGHFEPARGKGLVARATLYFIVAHPQFISTEVYSEEQIETLIEWSNAEAPNDYEKHRNETIFEVQGNRNPFIDFPDWVNKVDFLRGMN